MRTGIATALMLAASIGMTGAQPASNTIDEHRANAKRAAGLDFPGTLSRICVVPRAGEGGGGRGGLRVIPDRSTWYAEPARMFDNLYFVGTKIHSSWALKTSAGIILIDTLYDYAAEPEIVDGLKKLHLDPAQVKYVIISHAHGDHDQGAALLQSRYGTKVVMGAPDWDTTLKRPADAPGGVPKQDIAAQDGQKITLGDTTVTIVTTPGHTPGTLSLLFPVKDHGKTLTVAYSGGTAFNFPDDAPHYDIYIDSQHKFAKAAADAGATVLMSNHSEFDNAWLRSKLVKVRAAGEAHPYEVGAEAIARYFTMTGECAQARKLELGAGK